MEKVIFPKKYQMWPVEKLTPYPRNARVHSEEQISKICTSIITFGFTNPILIDKDGGIVAGHGRYLAALRLGLPQVPTIDLSHLSKAQKRAYILADNKLAEGAEWDLEQLSSEILELLGTGADLSVTGFSNEELVNLADLATPYSLENDQVEPVPVDPISRAGDRWTLGGHQLLCGDSTNYAVLKSFLSDRLIDCVWTDPPYNVNYKGTAGKITNDDMEHMKFRGFLRNFFSAVFLVMKPGAVIYVCHADTEGLNFRLEFRQAGFHLSGCLIWRKNAIVLGRSDYQWQHEPILYGWKPGEKHFYGGGRSKSTMLDPIESIVDIVSDSEVRISADKIVIVKGPGLSVSALDGSVFKENKPTQNKEHPTMKPVPLIEKMLLNSTLPEHVVLDPFAGSGSVIIACERLGRKCFAVEIDPKYCDVIIKRWQGFTGESAIHVQEKKTFNECSASRR